MQQRSHCKHFVSILLYTTLPELYSNTTCPVLTNINIINYTFAYKHHFVVNLWLWFVGGGATYGIYISVFLSGFSWRGGKSMLTVILGGHAIGALGGSGGMLPQKILRFFTLWNQFSCNMSGNLLNYALKAFKSYTLKGGHRSFKGGQIAPSAPPLKETLHMSM